jgi:uncharacterized surface protein with fasciclin (FAS1) repeats
MKAFRNFLLLLPAAALLLVGCDSNDNSATDEEPAQTIVDVAVGGGFTTLVAAVQAADLVSVLDGDGPFTVFAPTDAAFAKLPAGTLDNLLLPENKDQLTAILTYHVVPGRVTSGQVVGLSKAETVQGSDLSITVNEGVVSINDARVVQTDIEASNGIVHVIDSVLLPPAE